MRRALIISADFPPQGGTGAIRVTKFVKYLPQMGWEPVVVCSDTEWNRDESLAQEVPPGVVVRRVPWPAWVRAARLAPSAPAAAASGETRPASAAARLRRWVVQATRPWVIPDVFALWAGAAERACLEVLREFPCEVVFTTSPPHSIHLVGRRLQRRLGLPWVADFRDVWTAENPDLERLGWLNFALQRRAERATLAACDHAVMVTEPLGQRACEVFDRGLAQKCSVITNGFDPQDFADARPSFDRDALTITYTGTLLGPQANNSFPEGLRLALAQSETFRRQAQIRFVGRLDPRYQARLAGLERNVTVTGFVEHRAAADLARRSHLLLMILPDTPLASMTFTNKFFEYLAARRPILALAPPGLVADIMTRERLGLVAPPGDPPAIAQALLRMFESVRAQPDGYAASEALLARFDRRALTAKLASVLEAVSQRQGQAIS